MKARQMSLFDAPATPVLVKISPQWKPCELERRAMVEAGQCVVANVDKTTGDKALVARAIETGRMEYIGNSGNRHKWPQSDWGNEFTKKHGTLPERIAAYRAKVCDDPVKMDRARRELPGKVLGCWCYPEPCHGTFLAAIANGTADD